jgi:hypothetical protein
MHNLNASSKMNADWDFFLYLKNIGRETAEEWLKNDWKDVGKKSTLDIREKFLSGPGSQPDHGELAARIKTLEESTTGVGKNSLKSKPKKK